MAELIYDFAMTLDGYICREDGSCDGFLGEGGHLQDYLDRLQQYQTVVMGRKTYEYGYQFGLEPGKKAYEHMEHYVFSDTLRFDHSEVNVVGLDRLDLVEELKRSSAGPIYLCGGGTLAGHLLKKRLIDQLVVKLNPLTFGSGVAPFAETTEVGLRLQESKSYENGVVLLRYAVEYAGD